MLPKVLPLLAETSILFPNLFSWLGTRKANAVLLSRESSLENTINLGVRGFPRWLFGRMGFSGSAIVLQSDGK